MIAILNPLFALLAQLSIISQGKTPLGHAFQSNQPQIGDRPSNVLHPIILIPGYMGSLLEGSWDRESVQWPGLCSTRSNGHTLWFNVANFGPFVKDCWLDNFKLNHDPVNRKSYSDRGVTVYTKGWGSGSSVDYISPPPQQIYDSMYFHNMIEEFERLGYIRDHNVRGAPYDWRKAFHENDFGTNLRSLVEETYVANNQTSIILLCHSMGCQFSYAFLQSQSTEWKFQYLKAWVILGAPFGGTFKYLYGSFADDDYPANMFSIIRSAERTFSSKQFLLPRVATYGDDVLVQTDSKNYTASDYKEFFSALNQPSAYEQWLVTKDIYQDASLSSPGDFPILCVVGVSKETPEKAIIEGELNPSNVRWKTIYGDGDQYVNAKSGRMCQKFGQNNDNFIYRELNVEHMDMIRGREGISVVSDFVDSLNRNLKLI